MSSKFIFPALIGLYLIHPAAHAYSTIESEIINGCKKINYYAEQGNKAYQKNNFNNALEAYEQQASWLSFCTLHEDLTGKIINENQLATAYNNVGLTYRKLNQPRWARAWYSIMLKDEKSQFNLKALGPLPSTTQKSGKYVKYIGQGQWDTIEVKPKDQNYIIDYNGLRMGLNGLVGGPNMGQFSTTMNKSAHKVRYTDDESQCVISIEFNRGDSLRVKQNQSDCGFGMGVYAEGFYWKVES